ncbi:MAG TPA: LytR C-terminal domain-containing protein [Bacteroidota bacterium]
MVDRKDPHTDPAPSTRPAKSSDPDKRFRLRTIVIGAATALMLVVIFLLSGLGTSTQDSEIVLGEKVHTIQLDVLNGVGRTNLAQHVTDYLRSKGFDVVETGNFKEELEKTLVIDRTGNSKAAVQVAEALGVPMEQVMQKIDKTLYLDVSVYLGKDYQSLQPFR